MVGLALQFSPYWQRFDSNVEARQTLSGDLRLIADWNLMPDDWFAAANLAYQPERSTFAKGGVERITTIELSGSISHRFQNNLFLGGEIRFLSKYQSYSFDELAGRAVYVGPTLLMTVGENGYVGAAWSVQVKQNVKADLVRTDDSTQLERHQFRLKAGFSF
jgi:hypothetical protein